MAFTFDETWDHQFKTSPFRLRYELGGEEFDNIAQPVPRFMRAMVRSRAIHEATFAGSKQLFAVVESCRKGAFKGLAKLGFQASPVAQWRVDYEMPDNAVDSSQWRAFDVTDDEAACDTLLWSSIVREMPLRPGAPVSCHFIDVERGILFHVYDDRGMDVTALAASSLTDLRQRFDSWVLPYDRSRMESAFAL